MKKRGVSPVIATVMLIAIVIILAAIVFLWAQGFLTERSQKFGGPAEDSCGKINFEVEAIDDSGSSEDKVYIVNRGNVPIYGVELRKKGTGFIKSVGVFERTITVGDTGFIELPEEFVKGDKMVVVPIILTDFGGAKKAFSCEVDAGKEIEVRDGLTII